MAHLCLISAVSGFLIGAYILNVWALSSAITLILFFGSTFDLIRDGQLDNIAVMRWVAVLLSMQLGYLVGAMAHHLIHDEKLVPEEDDRKPQQ